MIKGQAILRQSLDIGCAGTITIELEVMNGVIFRDQKDNVGPLGRTRTNG